MDAIFEKVDGLDGIYRKKILAVFLTWHRGLSLVAFSIFLFLVGGYHPVCLR